MNLLGFGGPIGRATYLGVGLALMSVKALLDRVLFGTQLDQDHAWRTYWFPLPELANLVRQLDVARGWLGMLVVAFPFVWIGIALTVRRLRDLGASAWLSCLFFVPVLNLLFFLLLCLLPGRGHATSLPPAVVPADAPSEGRSLSEIMVAGALSAAVGSALAAFGAVYIRSYGWGLFVCTPFVMGLTASVWVDHRGRRGFRTHLAAALFGLTLAALLLLAFAIEGALCLLMAAPLAIGLAVLGTVVGRQVMGQRLAPGALPAIGAVAAGLPLLMTFEGATLSAPPAFALASEVVIDAPPAVVWREVIEFRPIPEPREFIFTHGIAFPLRAEISGRGAGAIRRCIFNTGTFVEPIEVWEENRRLKFSVTENPPPMIEWSPFQIAPSHLSGFLVSSAGEFALEPLPGGGTRLIGTTWYRHSLWPSAYWRLWSDAIIHRIHLRVLDHIKRHAEADRRRPA